MESSHWYSALFTAGGIAFGFLLKAVVDRVGKRQESRIDQFLDWVSAWLLDRRDPFRALGRLLSKDEHGPPPPRTGSRDPDIEYTAGYMATGERATFSWTAMKSDTKGQRWIDPHSPSREDISPNAARLNIPGFKLNYLILERKDDGFVLDASQLDTKPATASDDEVAGWIPVVKIVGRD